MSDLNTFLETQPLKNPILLRARVTGTEVRGEVVEEGEEVGENIGDSPPGFSL